MGKNIVLIGFMGTGKTSVGAILAQKLDKEFIDMDREIESIHDMTIADIFKQYGEAGFRSEESAVAEQLGEQEDIVIATGGGTPTFKENVAFLRANGLLICLDADPVDISDRINGKKGTRPMLARNGVIEDIERLLKAREPFYSAAADIRIDTSGKNLKMVANEILNLPHVNQLMLNQCRENSNLILTGGNGR